jgi:ribose-phosphate pyrophosphokinase
MNVDDSLRLIVMNNCSEFGRKVDEEIRKERKVDKSYIVPIVENRFSNGEGKVVITETIRNKDVYILSDVGNHSSTYNMYGYTTHMGPDEHFQDIKRVISAIRSHASHITVVTPLLYASRQHRRKGRESLDCAVALQELEKLGVDSIVTFDAHDPNVQNAIPCSPFENFYPTNEVLKHFIKKEKINFKNVIVVSPDTGVTDCREKKW